MLTCSLLCLVDRMEQKAKVFISKATQIINQEFRNRQEIGVTSKAAPTTMVMLISFFIKLQIWLLVEYKTCSRFLCFEDI